MTIEHQNSVAHIGPQSEYNPRGACPTNTELDEMCGQMAEMERKFQDEFKAWSRKWRTEHNLPSMDD